MRNMPNSSPIIKISQDIFLRHNHINRLSYSKQAKSRKNSMCHKLSHGIRYFVS